MNFMNFMKDKWTTIGLRESTLKLLEKYKYNNSCSGYDEVINKLLGEKQDETKKL